MARPHSGPGSQAQSHDAGHDAWGATVRQVAERGVSLRHILDLSWGLFEQSYYDPSISTTRDVVFESVIPLTSSSMCSYAEFVNQGQHKRPKLFVTHLWANKFSLSVAAMVAAATGSPTYEDIAIELATREGTETVVEDCRTQGWLELAFWFCALSINQHKSICHIGQKKSTCPHLASTVCNCSREKVTRGSLSEINKFSDVMAHLHSCGGVSQVVVVDPNFGLFARAWCVAELVQANKQGIEQLLKLHSVKGVAEHREHLKKLDVRNCKASDPRDLETILAGIPDPDAFNEHLRALLLDSKSGLLPAWQKIVHGYFLEWNGFTEEFVAKVNEPDEDTAGDTIRLFALFLLPVMPVLPLFSAFTLPDPDDARSILVFSAQFAILPLFGFSIVMSLIKDLFQMEWVQFDMHKVVLSVLVGGAIPTAGVFATSALTGWWPLPLFSITQAPFVLLGLMVLMMAIPKEARQKLKLQGSKRKVIAGMIAVLTVVSMLRLVMPFIATLMSAVDGQLWLHSLLAIGLLLGRLAAEWSLHIVARHLTADVLPVMMWCLNIRYELLLCVAMARGHTWWLFAQLVGFDIIENAYHLWSLARQRLQERSKHNVTGSDQAAEGREQFILGQLLLRELAQLTSPINFLCLLCAFYFGKQKRHHDIVCHWTFEDFELALQLLVMELAVELAVVVPTWAVMICQGRRPWRVLRALVHKNLFGFVAMQTCNVILVVTEQITGSGTDYHLDFNWLHTQGATWDCGVTWDS